MMIIVAEVERHTAQRRGAAVFVRQPFYLWISQFRPHALRHSFATDIRNRGDIGHRMLGIQAVIAQRYLHGRADGSML